MRQAVNPLFRGFFSPLGSPLSHIIKSRISYSAKLNTLAPDTLEAHIHAQLDLAGVPHHTFTDDALHPHSSCTSPRASCGPLETSASAPSSKPCDRTKTVDLKQINAVLMQVSS